MGLFDSPRWLSTTPVIADQSKTKVKIATSAVSKVSSYFDLPAFSIPNSSPIATSRLVLQFNYTSVHPKFTINYQTPPLVNFIACVKYRIGTVVYRYKLWDSPTQQLYVPLYNGEVIRKNFCVEIWSNNIVITNPTLIRYLLSPKYLPSPLYQTDPYLEAQYNQATDLDLTIPIVGPCPSNIDVYWITN